MSIDANTYEELNINNVNEKTADLASQVSKYLLETWGIICLGLIVDGVSYNSTEERIEELRKQFYSNKHKPFRISGLYALILFILAITLFLFYM